MEEGDICRENYKILRCHDIERLITFVYLSLVVITYN